MAADVVGLTVDEDVVYFGLDYWNADVGGGYELEHDESAAGRSAPGFFALPAPDDAEAQPLGETNVRALRLRAARVCAQLPKSTTAFPPLKQQPPWFSAGDNAIPPPPPPPSSPPLACDLSDFDWNDAYQTLSLLRLHRPRSVFVLLSLRKLMSCFEQLAAQAVCRPDIFSLLASASPPDSDDDAGDETRHRRTGVVHHKASNLLVQCATSFTVDAVTFSAMPWSRLLGYDATLEAKMVAHHLKGIRACLASPDVSLPLVAVVDYCGHRFYVTPPVPVPVASLRTPAVNPSSLPLGQHLVSHQLCTANADVCFARHSQSTSVVGHRPLVWNLARLLPPQAVPLETYALLVPCQSTAAVVAKTVDLPRVADLLLLLPADGDQAAVRSVSFAGLHVHYASRSTAEVNERATAFVGFTVRGHAVITAAASSAHLWSRLRAEHIQTAITQSPLSPDAFAKLGATVTDAAHHYGTLLREASARLFEVSIPRCISFILQSFSDWMHVDHAAGELKETSSMDVVFFAATISDLAHRFGINYRYLPLLGVQLLRRTPNPRFFANVVLTEIVARVIKTLARLHASRDAGDASSFLRFYNDRLLSTSFWHTSIKLHPAVYRFLDAFCQHFALGSVHTCDPRGMVDLWFVVQRAFSLLYAPGAASFSSEASKRVRAREPLRPYDLVPPAHPAASLRVRLSFPEGDYFAHVGDGLIERADKHKHRVNRDWLLALAGHFSLRALVLRVRHHDGPARIALVRAALAGARRQLHRTPHDPDLWTVQGQCFLALATTRMKSRHLIDDPHQPFDPFVFDDLRFAADPLLGWDDGQLQTPSSLLRRAMVCAHRALLLDPAHSPALGLLRAILRLSRLDLPLTDAAKLLVQEHSLAANIADQQQQKQQQKQQQELAHSNNNDDDDENNKSLFPNDELLSWGAELFVSSTTSMRGALQSNPHDADTFILVASSLDAFRQLAMTVSPLAARERHLDFIIKSYEQLLVLPCSSKSLRAYVLTGLALAEYAMSRVFAPTLQQQQSSEVSSEQITQWQLLGRAIYHLFEALCSSETPMQRTIEASLQVVAYWSDILPKVEKMVQMKQDNQGSIVDQIIVWKDVITKSKRKYLNIIDSFYQRGVTAFYRARQEWATSEHRAHRSFLTAHQSLRRCLEFQTNPAVTKAVATNLYTWGWKLICAARALDTTDDSAPDAVRLRSMSRGSSSSSSLLAAAAGQQPTRLPLQEIDCVFEIATSKLDKAIKVHASCAEAHYNYGLALYFQSKKHQELARVRYFVQRSSEKYARATELKPDYHQAWFNWGVSLDELAETEAAHADKQKQQRPSVDSDLSSSSSSSMSLLSGHSSSKVHPVLALYYEAASHYCSALKSKPDKLEALTNLGQIFVRIASFKQSSASEKLKMFRRVRSRYSEIRHVVQSQCSAAFNVEFKMQHARAMLNDPEDDPYAAEAAGMRVAHPLPFKGKTGFLYKRGQVIKNWKRRWFKLDAVNLEYHRDDSAGTTIKGRIPLRDIVGVHAADPPNDEQGSHMGGFFFEVVCHHQRVLLVRAATEEDRAEWVATIKAYIQ